MRMSDGDVQRQLIEIEQGGDLGLAGGQGIGRCPHIRKGDLGRIGIGVGNGRQDLFIDIGGQRPPVALGRIAFLALEQGRFLVLHAVTDDRGAENLHPFRTNIFKFKRLFIGLCWCRRYCRWRRQSSRPANRNCRSTGSDSCRRQCVETVGVLSRRPGGYRRRPSCRGW